MKRKISPLGKKSIALSLSLLILTVPVLAQQGQTQKAVEEAQIQAKKDAGTAAWVMLGIVLIGIPLSQIIQPKPPQEALLGKSPEYVSAYTDAYQQEVKKIRMDNSLIGFGISAAAVVLYLVFTAGKKDPTPRFLN